MSLLYLIKFTIEYKGIPQKQFIKIWATEAEVALKAKEKGKILQIWKVSEKKNVSILLVVLILTAKLGYWVNSSTQVISRKEFWTLDWRLQRLRIASW